MRDVSGGLEKKEGVFRSGAEDAAAPGIACEVIMVVPRFVAKKRELETVLAIGLSMTATAIAAILGKNGDEVVGEGNGGGVTGFDDNLFGKRVIAVGGGEGGLAGSKDGDQASGRDRDDVGRVAVIGGRVGDVGGRVGSNVGEDDLVGVVEVVEGNFFWRRKCEGEGGCD